MKKISILFCAFLLITGSISAQTDKSENLKFSRDFIACHQLLISTYNYNHKAEIAVAFLNEAARYLQSAEGIFNTNKKTWEPKLSATGIEDVEKMFTQFHVLIDRGAPITDQELGSATLWLRVADIRTREIVQKLIE